MDYKVITAKRAKKNLDDILYYLQFCLENETAAEHLLDGIEIVYSRLADNPYQFPEYQDIYLKKKRYREAILTGMDYRIIFQVEQRHGYILGFFH